MKKAKEVSLKMVEAELDGGYGIFAGNKAQWATLVFASAAAPWVSREVWHPQQKTRWLADGRVEMKLPYTHETELVMDVLRHGADVEISSPPALRARLQARLAQMVKVYGGAWG